MMRKRSYAVFIIQLVGADQSLHVRSLKRLSFGDNEVWEGGTVKHWSQGDLAVMIFITIFMEMMMDDDDEVGTRSVGCVCVCPHCLLIFLALPTLPTNLTASCTIVQPRQRPRRRYSANGAVCLQHSAVSLMLCSRMSSCSVLCSLLILPLNAAQFYNLDLNKLCSRMSSCSVLVLPLLAEQCGWRRLAVRGKGAELHRSPEPSPPTHQCSHCADADTDMSPPTHQCSHSASITTANRCWYVTFKLWWLKISWW